MTIGRRLLVLGASGQVACDLPVAARRHGFVEVVAIGRETCDLTTADANVVIDGQYPDAIVNAAAYTAVDQAESDREAAMALNADMPGRFAAAAAARDIPFVQISTDYVFDGTKRDPYLESDVRCPIGVYGASKAAGEEAVEAAGGRAVILRTAWVYGPHAANFLKTMVRLAKSRDELGVVADQVGCPTHSMDVAEGAARAAALLCDRACSIDPILNCAGAGEASWADFAQAIFQEEAARGRPSPRVRRITTADYPTPARRPANSRLDSARLAESLGWRPEPWRDRLARHYRESAPD